MQNHAALNKIIKVYRSPTHTIVLPQDRTDYRIGQTVAKTDKCIFQLVLIDVAAAVAIKRSEAILPVGDILPESAKFLETNCAAVFLVEHTWGGRIFIGFVNVKHTWTNEKEKPSDRQ